MNDWEKLTAVPVCLVCILHKVDGREYMEDDDALYAALRKVNRAGVVVLENVGVAEGTVADIARRVAPLSHQALYGDIFDVIAQVSGEWRVCR